MAPSEPPVALVLAGGGRLGAVQVGMLRALVETGLRPALVIGSSVLEGDGASSRIQCQGVTRRSPSS